MPDYLNGISAWVFALAVLVAVVGAARFTRLVVHDTFPPVVAIRIWWSRRTGDSDWGKLMECHWCFSYWATLAAVGTFFLTPLSVVVAWIWWLLWGTLALSYLVAQYVHFDEGRQE